MTNSLLINKPFPENTLSQNIKILQDYLSLKQVKEKSEAQIKQATDQTLESLESRS